MGMKLKVDAINDGLARDSGCNAGGECGSAGSGDDDDGAAVIGDNESHDLGRT